MPQPLSDPPILHDAACVAVLIRFRLTMAIY
jgi:hypothetical protein